MAIYKDEKYNTWKVVYRYTDWKGQNKQTTKRGFKTKREAKAWEAEQMNIKTASLDMTFESFVEQYRKDMLKRIKLNTWQTKDNIIQSKLIPYFGALKMSKITAQQVITWQNEMMAYVDEKGKPYSPVYLRSINSQLSAIFNHAVKFYNLRENPCVKAGSMGKKKNREMLFWTKQEYLKFADVMMEKPDLYYAFEILYWCGLREGEMLALTPGDFDFENKTVTVSKSYQKIKGVDYITTPKTEKSNRTVLMPEFLSDEIQEYLTHFYDLGKDDRIFLCTRHALLSAMTWGSEKAGVKRIRIHDLRHSHVSLLIDMGMSAVTIADRVGHESIDITLQYAHMFPNRQAEIAERLNLERNA